MIVFNLVGFYPRKAVERQAITNGRIAVDKKKTFGPREPMLAGPIGTPLELTAAEREDVADGFEQAAFEDAQELFAAARIIEFGIFNVEIDGEFALAPHVVDGVFVRGHDVAEADFETACQGLDELAGVFCFEAVVVVVERR